MERYPILFGRRELIEGNGFIAGVEIAGRALMSNEDGEYWVEGVNPGGFASKGAGPGEALAAFCVEFRLVLFDIAMDAADFSAFKAEVEKFFHATNQVALQEWEAAVTEVREGKITAEWLDKRPADSPLRVNVEQIHQPKAAHNQEGAAAIAA
ncbi:MAG TPA: hypothetical protein VKM72_05555 [Thermoanaerobaculia bacterium]|nr:hypothetical protein [Thermoanaerobaculia bacterium]